MPTAPEYLLGHHEFHDGDVVVELFMEPRRIGGQSVQALKRVTIVNNGPSWWFGVVFLAADPTKRFGPGPIGPGGSYEHTFPGAAASIDNRDVVVQEWYGPDAQFMSV